MAVDVLYIVEMVLSGFLKTNQKPALSCAQNSAAHNFPNSKEM